MSPQLPNPRTWYTLLTHISIQLKLVLPIMSLDMNMQQKKKRLTGSEDTMRIRKLDTYWLKRLNSYYVAKIKHEVLDQGDICNLLSVIVMSIMMIITSDCHVYRLFSSIRVSLSLSLSGLLEKEVTVLWTLPNTNRPSSSSAEALRHTLPSIYLFGHTQEINMAA